ncbi:MAG TPA: hypothetical protein VMV69_16530 [Pirellulales bacterium]|nr:hypothetical protein [Pirellulales bacterium]
MPQPPTRSKQIVRRVPSARLGDFDEQLWPVNVLLLILAGFVAGIIAAQSDFDTPRVLYNGWCRLGVLGLIVAALAWGVMRLDGWMRRRLQFGVFLSLLVHLWLSMITYHVYLGLFEQPETDVAEPLEEPRLVKLPDYHWHDDAREVAADETLETPVETVTPDRQPEEVVRSEVERVPAERPAEEEPQAEQRQPNPADIQKAELTAPHRANDLAGWKISRREVDMPSPAEQVEAPRIDSRPRQPPAPDAQVTPHQRQAASAQIERRDAMQPASDVADVVQAAPARRQPIQTASLDSPREAPAPARRPTPAAGARSAPVESVPESPRVEAARPTRLAPAMADVARRETSPTAARRDPSPMPESPAIAPADVAAAPRRTHRTAQARGGPQVAVVRSRAAAEAVSPSVVPNQPATTDPATQNPAAQTPVELEAATGEIARSAGSRSTPDRRTVEGEERAVTAAAAAPIQPQRAAAAGGAGTTGQAAAPAPVGRQSGAEPAVVEGQVEVVELGLTAPTPSSAGAPGQNDLGEPAISGGPRRVADLPARAGAPATLDDAGATADGASPTFASGAAAAPRRSDAAVEVGSTMAGTPARAAQGKTRGSEAIGGDAAADGPAIDASPSDAPSGGEDQLAARTDLETGHKSSKGLPVRIAAPEGPGGLSATPALDVGLPSRRARVESKVVHSGVGRMILERSGGKLAAVRVQDTSVPGFRQRDREMRRELANQRGGSEASERAVEAGLDFLARHQNPDGSWSLHEFWQGRPGYENAGAGEMHSDTAATGLSLLAFLGAGYTHTDGKYRPVVARGLAYLVGNQGNNGDLFVPQDAKSNINVWLYSHGIASIALGEAYGMTRDATLRDPAQRALSFIAAAQSPTEGGWRYAPRQGSDTSVSGWQLMALKSGELAGLQVSPECYQRVTAWLDGAQAQANPAVYVYRPKAKQPHQRAPSRVMTAEALLMRQYLGWRRDNPSMQAGADYLRANLPQWGTANDRRRDAYYWYYATQVMFQVGGPHWEEWNGRLRALLIESQAPEGPLGGSWQPRGATPDRWGREGGRIYVTAMHLLMLEVYYRHLPLYQNLQE